MKRTRRKSKRKEIFLPKDTSTSDGEGLAEAQAAMQYLCPTGAWSKSTQTIQLMNKTKLLLIAIVALAPLAHADQTAEEIQAQKIKAQEDIKKDREREALRTLLEAITKSQSREPSNH